MDRRPVTWALAGQEGVEVGGRVLGREGLSTGVERVCRQGEYLGLRSSSKRYGIRCVLRYSTYQG